MNIRKHVLLGIYTTSTGSTSSGFALGNGMIFDLNVGNTFFVATIEKSKS